jgi:endonuclease/exonuclease/phosphatase family metal-dependent hydrolase
MVVAGDFNQRVPPHRQPRAMVEALTVSLDGLSLCTAGETEHGGLIDHVATTADLAASIESFLAKRVDEGPLSDHTGVVVTVTARV